MCSTSEQPQPAGLPSPAAPTAEQRLSELGLAIDDLAAGTRGADDVARLARLWSQLAELEPEIARRMPTYQADGRTARLALAG